MFVQRYYLPLWVCLFLHLCVCVKERKWEKIDMFYLDLFLSWFCVFIVYFNLSHLVLLFFLLSINSTLHCVLTNTVIAKVRPLPLTPSNHIPNLTTGNKVPSLGKSTLRWDVCWGVKFSRCWTFWPDDLNTVMQPPTQPQKEIIGVERTSFLRYHAAILRYHPASGQILISAVDEATRMLGAPAVTSDLCGRHAENKQDRTRGHVYGRSTEFGKRALICFVAKTEWTQYFSSRMQRRLNFYKNIGNKESIVCWHCNKLCVDNGTANY